MPKMSELIASGLFGRGLITIDHPSLVDRYNACLRYLGLTETSLSTFQIDKMGWSPEIAAEQSNDYYLCHGDANPLAIVLTPEQTNAPIYFPMHSFDWRLMDQWFTLHKIPIADLTRDTGICLDIDQEVDLYGVPADLLMVSEVIVRVSTPDGLMTRADAQQNLVRRWLTEPEAHLDVDLIRALKTTTQTEGDLRRRHLIIRDMQYSDVLDFYSRKFGGSFVLRSQNKSPLIFVRDANWVAKDKVYAADVNALSVLIEHGYVDTDIEWWQKHLYHFKVVAESFLLDVVDVEEPLLDFAEIKDVRKRQLVHKYGDRLPIYLELVRLREALKQGVIPDSVSDEARVHLFHPSDTLSPSSREVVWQLLTYIQGGRFVPLMYRHQKTAFVEAFTTKWGMPRSSWAIALVRQYYDIASKSSDFDW